MENSEKTPLLNSNSNSLAFEDSSPVYHHYEQTSHYVNGNRNNSAHRESRHSIGVSSSGIEGVLPIALSWTDVHVSVTIPGRKRGCCGPSSPAVEKRILKGVNGLVKPGSLLAIMGASGAGKSTLLNVLTQRNVRSYNVSGEIRVNGWQIREDIKNVSAYVQQDDLFIGTLTVREQLQFRALLRMDKKLDRAARLARVEEVINEMGLTEVANSRIGNAGGTMKGISGGERKRLTFASEALTNPPLFFCDEPTSGLDSFMAQNIVNTLQKMAANGRAILCTIHQPSSELFAMFNQILLLAEGRTAFMGTRDETMEYFESLNFPCPVNYNPADHYILTMAIVPGKEGECRKRTNAICDAFEESSFASAIKTQNEELVEKARFAEGDAVVMEATREESRYETSWLTQFRYLIWRAWISQFRDTLLFRVRVMQAIISALVFGLVYLQLSVDQKGVMNINGAIFVVIVNLSFSNLFAVINTLPIEMGIFLREYGSKLYRTDAYYLSKSLAEMPIFLTTGVLFVSMVYWMMGLYDSAEAFGIALGILLLTVNVAIALGYLISTVAGSVTVALSFAPLLLIPFMLFGGFFLNSDAIPVYFIWLEYISWFKYATEILLVNQWRNIDHIPCGNSTVTTNTTQPPNPNAFSECLYQSGEGVLKYYSFEEDNITHDIGAMVALIVGFRVLAFFVLLLRARRSKE